MEALLIFITSMLIINEAINKLMKPSTESMDETLMFAGIIVMGISVVANLVVSSRLMKKLTNNKT
jgi:Co/Zn/Cd efflux system component